MKNIKQLVCLFTMHMIVYITHAQVPVIKEPRHKPVLVNDYVRIA